MTDDPVAPQGTLARLLRQRERMDEEEAAQVDAAIRWLEDKWGRDRECPYCNARAWAIGTPIELTIGNLHTSTPAFASMSPAFPVMCSNCGNTVLINAIVSGVVREEE